MELDVIRISISFRSFFILTLFRKRQNPIRTENSREKPNQPNAMDRNGTDVAISGPKL